MSPELAAHLTRAIKDRVEAHHESVQGLTQWYADDLAIDCDADEFWKVVERALVEAGPPDTPLTVP